MQRAFIVLGALAVAACADLPPISVDVCGNHVVEPARGEDCDGSAPPGATCGKPGTSQACRYRCSTQADCPSGYSCGQDGLCRTSSGTWSTLSTGAQHTPETPLDIVIADADGDGLGDLFEEAPSDMTVHYDVASSTQTELSVAHDSILPIIGPVTDLSGDRRADVVVPADLGYFVSLGNAARVESATAYGIPLPGDVTDVQALSADILPDSPGTEILVLAELSLAGKPPEPVLVNVATTGVLSFIGQLPDVPSKLAGPVRAGKLDQTGPVERCDELVMGYAGKTSIDLLVPCTLSGKTTELATDARTSSVALPPGATIAAGVSVEDVNRDGHLDIVVPAARHGVYELDVAYGRGDGTFDSTPSAAPTTPPDGSAGTAATAHASVPLAVFDLDGDETPDFIDATGVYLSRPGGDAVVAAANHAAPWTTAVVARFDADDLLDVAVGSSDAPGLTVFLNSAGGSLTAFPLATRGNVTVLGAGDFDGDRVGDLAVVTTTMASPSTTSGSEAPTDTLSVVFGSPYGSPMAPKDIGQFHRIEQLATARVASGDPEVLDAADELGALAEDEDGIRAFAIIFGAGNRDLRSPYDLTRTSIDDADVTAYGPFRIVTGDVDGDGAPDVITLGQSIDDTTDNRIFANPMRGAASIELGKSTFSDSMGALFDWEHVLAAALDLDGTPGDEVVIVGPSADGSGHRYAIARATTVMGSATYSLGAPTPLGMTFRRTETALADPSQRNGRLRVADVDGDGARDLVALGQKGDRGALVVYFTEGDGGLGAATSPAGMEQLDVRDFAVVQAPGDGKPRLALLTTTGIYVVTARGRELTVGAAPALSMTANAPTSPGLITAGDVDGDGVPDLALGGPLGFEVHLGISANVADRR
jgi:hypothetical protein